MADRFTFHGADLPFFDHPYNTTLMNERSVEIPITMNWLHECSQRNGSILEVGNVLSHYFPEVAANRRIVDAYEEADGVENLDVFDIRGTYDYIFAISTLEHVRWDPPEQRQLNGAANAVEHLYGLLAPEGRMLVTVPFGSNPGLDYAILHGGMLPPVHRQGVMIRGGGVWHLTSATGRWECRGSEWFQATDIWWVQYGKSTPWADAVWIGEYEK